MRQLKTAGLMLFGLLAILVAIPVGLVAARGDDVERLLNVSFATTGKKALIAEAARPYGLPSDPSLTPMQVGELMHSMRAEKDRDGGTFVFRRDVPAVTPRWRETPFDTTLFPNMHRVGWEGPDSRMILELAAARPTSAQRAYLNAIAADPIWRVWDQIGTAAAADVLGGQFEIPFTAEARWYDMPLPKFAATKELAYAAVSRAAAHLAAQRPDSAEHALRSIIAFGFVMSDNAPTLIEQLVGVVIVGIGREGLERFYAIRNDPRGRQLALRLDSLTKQSEADENLPTIRALNYERAASAAFAPCTNVKELIFGRNAENQARLDSFREAAARYPSDHAFFDLVERNSEESIKAFGYAEETGAVMRAVHGATRLAGKVTANPRLATCGILATSGW